MRKVAEKVERLTVSLPKDDVDALKAVADRTGLGMSFLIRRAIKCYVATGTMRTETMHLEGDER